VCTHTPRGPQEAVEARLLAATTPGLVAKPAKEKGAMAALRLMGRSMLPSSSGPGSGRAASGAGGEEGVQGFLASVPSVR
jgi:hypothetical protein